MYKVFIFFVLLAFVSCQSGNKSSDEENNPTEPVQVVETTINIGGMTCDMCVASVEKGVNALEGIAEVKVSLSDSNAVVKYDASKVELAEIEKAIEKRGYSIKGQ